MEPNAVSHYREAGVNFLLMDVAGLLIETGLIGGGGGWGGSSCSTQLFRR